MLRFYFASFPLVRLHISSTCLRHHNEPLTLQHFKCCMGCVCNPSLMVLFHSCLPSSYNAENSLQTILRITRLGMVNANSQKWDQVTLWLHANRRVEGRRAHLSAGLPHDSLFQALMSGPGQSDQVRQCRSVRC
jgi:hypothetical protein